MDAANNRIFHKTRIALSRNEYNIDVRLLREIASKELRACCVFVSKPIKSAHHEVRNLVFYPPSDICGESCIARFPFGPGLAYDDVEINTIEFVREKTDIPVPRIFYNGLEDFGDGVGGPFLLMERMEGDSLGHLWSRLNLKQRTSALMQVGEMIGQLAKIPLQCIGSIRRKEKSNAFYVGKLRLFVLDRPNQPPPPYSSLDQELNRPKSSVNQKVPCTAGYIAEIGPFKSFSAYFRAIRLLYYDMLPARAHTELDMVQNRLQELAKEQMHLYSSPYCLINPVRFDDIMFKKDKASGHLKLTGIITWSEARVDLRLFCYHSALFRKAIEDNNLKEDWNMQVAFCKAVKEQLGDPTITEDLLKTRIKARYVNEILLGMPNWLGDTSGQVDIIAQLATVAGSL